MSSPDARQTAFSGGRILRRPRFRVRIAADPRPAPRLWQPLAALVAAAWTALVALAPVDVGEIALQPAACAAAAGTALLGGVSPPARRLLPLATAVLALLFLPAALAFAASGQDARPLLAGVALLVVAGATFGGRDAATRVRAAALAGAGTTLLAATIGANTESSWRLTPTSDLTAAALIAAGGLLLVASSGTVVAVAGLRPLMATGALLGLVGATALPEWGVALLLGAAALAVAELRPPLALGLLAIAAGAVAGGQPAAAVLGAGAVLATTVDVPAAGVLGLPGGVALAVALAQPGPLPARVILGVAAVLVAVGVGRSVGGAGAAGRGVLEIETRRLPALAVAAWFVVAPGTWTWTGDAGLEAYDTGMGRAVAVALLVLVTVPVLADVRRRRRRTAPAPTTAAG